MSDKKIFDEKENLLIDECYSFILELIKEAGKVVRNGFYKISLKDASIKQQSHELVTKYDILTEECIINGILAKYPDHKILAEETTIVNELTDSPTWIIDPIDGTINFVHGNPNVAISVALTIRKELAIGIIYNPLQEELYRSRKGQGSFMNDNPITASTVEKLEESVYSHEVSMLQPHWIREENLKRIYRFSTCARVTRCLGSAAITLAYVARGAIDCYTIDNLKAWDIAAGALLIREAGGKIYNHDGSQLDFMKGECVCAGTEQLCRILIDGLEECKKWRIIIEK